MNRREWLLCALSAGAGFVMMVYELVAARMLAPYVGSSTYVWTSVIGVIVAALSIGYWAGGRLADHRNRPTDISLLFLAVGIGIIMSLQAFRPALEWAMQFSPDVRIQALLATTVLYAPVSVLIGMVSPYLAKLNVRTLEQSGQSVANLSMFNALGGIFGTFLTGFFLFNIVGIRELMVALAVLSLALSWAMAPTMRIKKRLWASIAIIALSTLTMVARPYIKEIETASAHYVVSEGVVYGEKARMLITSPHGVQSAVAFNDPNKLLFWYTREMAYGIESMNTPPKSILLLGGGAFSLPRYLAEKLPETHIDVVEIDPKLVEIAREHFFYKDPANVTPIGADARTFLNSNTKQYDVVLVDAYGGDSIPTTLLTKEYGALLKRAVQPGGMVMINSIAGEMGACRELLDATLAPYRTEFEYARMKVRNTGQSTPTNIMAVFSDTPLDVRGYKAIGDTETSDTVYTDNFVPSDRLYTACEEMRS